MFLVAFSASGEKWVLYDSPKCARHWLSPRKPLLRTTSQHLRSREIMICIWWTSRVAVHYELLITIQTINGGLYSQQLEPVQKILKESALVNRKSVLLIHDNARPYVA